VRGKTDLCYFIPEDCFPLDQFHQFAVLAAISTFSCYKDPLWQQHNVLHVGLQRCEHGNFLFNHTALLTFSTGCGGCAAMSSTRVAKAANCYNKMIDLCKYLERNIEDDRSLVLTQYIGKKLTMLLVRQY
jgi:hypothetical protein